MLDDPENPFLSGNFAPTHDERDDTDLEVIGELPADLNGVFLRNGPNPRFEPLGRYHWFDGDGMVHAVRVQDGKASYRNRWVRSREFKLEESEGKALWTGVEEPPQFNNPHGMQKNPSNTSLVYHAGKLLSIWEGGSPYEMNIDDLSTVGRHTYDGKLERSFTAHPHVDWQTDELMFFGYSPMPPFLTYYVANAKGELVHAEQIGVPRGVMMHDFAITERYTIFFDLPAVMRPDRLMQGKSFINWEPEHGARIGVMERFAKGSDIKWYEVPPFYMYHHSNAYEDGNKLVITGGRSSGTFMLPDEDMVTQEQAEEHDDTAHFTRFELDLDSGAWTETRLDDAICAFENVREDLGGRRARYNYATYQGPQKPAKGPEFIGLRKYDLETSTFESHAMKSTERCGEGIFVPREGGTAEDDGYVVVFTHDEANGQSEFRVINAQDYSAEPIARVLMRARVPYGFHSKWVPGSKLR